MPLTEDYRIPQIEADLARIRQKIAGRKAGTEGVIPEEFKHVNAARAQEKQLQGLYVNQSRLERELIEAKLNSGTWDCAQIIKLMYAWEQWSKPPADQAKQG